MKRTIITAAAIFSFLLPVCASSAAEQKRSITIRGREEVTVTKKEVTLGDVADVASDDLSQAETVIGLKKVRIGESPKPGQEDQLSAYRILSAMKDGGVDINRVGYTFPKVVTVRRAARTLSDDEIMAAIQAEFEELGRDATVTRVFLPHTVAVAPGELELSVAEVRTKRRGRSSFEITALVENEAPTRFRVQALVDEWLEVPVARKSIIKGMIVGADDVMMARLNMDAIPADASGDTSAVVGYEANQTIGYGEVFRLGTLNVPALIESGEKVTMLYQIGSLSATATGIALEAGAQGQSIKIRNSSSSKIIVGQVVEPGLIKVSK